MTISTTSSLVTALGTGALSQFTFSFVGVAASDLVVTYTDANGNATVLPSSVYTVTLNPPGVGQLWGVGGTVTYPLTGSPIASGTTLTIERVLPLVQLTSISNQGDFYPNAVEQALDYVTMLTQQINDSVTRVVQGPPSDPSGLHYQLPAVAQRAGQLLSFDASGNVIVGQPSSAIVSAAMQPVVAAPTIAAADALLGPAMIAYFTAAGAFNLATRGFVNKLRNSTFVSWPNGTNGTIPTAGSGTTLITANGWAAQATGANGTWAQQTTGQNGTYYSLKLEGATSNTGITLAQRIGGSDGASLAGQTCTFQCAIYNNTGATLTPTLSTAYANSFENFTATTTDLAGVSLQGINNATWGIVAYTFAVSANASNGYQAKLSFGALNSNTEYVYVTACDFRVTSGITLGLNAAPPTPELADLSLETQRNAAYFETLYGSSSGRALIGTSQSGGGLVIAYWYFQAKKRAIPTYAFASGATWSGVTPDSADVSYNDIAFIRSDNQNFYAQSGSSYGPTLIAYADFW